MKWILSIFFILMLQPVLPQHLIRGKVSDGESNEVIAGATVYINNSTIRTSTNRDGVYTLRLPSVGSYELVVSAIGYELGVREINVSGEVQWDVVLQKKVVEIEEVAISPFLKDGWKEWGEYFTETFIGTTAFSKQTKILNPDALRFRYDKTDKVLTVLASEPLRISNRALGYDIDYDLLTYRMDFETKHLYFEGFASFQERRRVSRRVRRNREEACMSSLMRFVRSTYNHSWQEDGYVVRELIRVPNVERVRADSLMKVIRQKVVMDHQGNWTSYYGTYPVYNADSVAQFRQLLSQPAVYSMLGVQLEPQQIITTNERVGQKELRYENYLYVRHPDIRYEDAYFEWYRVADESSLMSLISGTSIWIDALGNFSPPANWIQEGYWAWYNKLATMLPLDYGLD